MAARLTLLIARINTSKFRQEKHRRQQLGLPTAFKSCSTPAMQREFAEAQKQDQIMQQVFAKTL